MIVSSRIGRGGLIGGRGAQSSIPTRRRRDVITDAKRKTGGGGSSPSPSSSGPVKPGGGGAATTENTKPRPKGDVRQGGAYTQETRKIILGLDKISKRTTTGKEILKNINLGMYLGAKIGVLGANGSGKSTLMKILAGIDQNCEGRVNLTPGIRVALLEQEPELKDGQTVGSNVEVAVKAVRALLTEYEALGLKMAEENADIDALSGKMDRLNAQIESQNAWEIDRTVDQAMDSLRCPPADALVDNLSGGERRRVALARLLLSPPDILLLDEPTNHLDAESVAWLERFLADFKGTVVAVTHDRYFLDNVAGWILELDRGSGIPFEGNYSEWLTAKSRRLALEDKAQSKLNKTISEELEFISQKAKGQQKKGQARMRRYEDLVSQAAAYVKTATLDSIVIPTGPRLGDVVVEAKGLSKSYGDRLLFDDLNFSIPPGAIVGIIGGNGAGKSTLFKMIMGKETPDGGVLRVGETVVPMYVDQSRESLDGNKTVFQEITEGQEEIDLNGRKINSRSYCNQFNFGGEAQQKKVDMLSGGERNRLHLAKTLKQSGNLLLLDEPTNDLDVDTLLCLETAITNFAGSVLCVSHDRWFLDRVATHILAYEGDSKVYWFEGGYSDYEEDRKKRGLGTVAPTRVKFRKLAN